MQGEHVGWNHFEKGQVGWNHFEKGHVGRNHFEKGHVGRNHFEKRHLAVILTCQTGLEYGLVHSKPV